MNEQAFDPRALRDAFGAFMTGVTVVTSHGADGKPIGFTANSFASVSLSPPLLLVCIARTSRNYAAMTGAGGFAVNVLAEDQKDVSNTFARSVEDRFATVTWRPGPHGAPVLDGVAAWFDCSTETVVEAGDHAILVGRVEAFGNAGHNGLGYARGGYFTAAQEAKLPPAAGLSVSAVAEQDGKVLLVDDGQGRLGLPSLEAGEANPADALADHLHALTGLEGTVGFLFSVFADRASGRQHVVYRAGLGPGLPVAGRLVPPHAIPFDRLDSPQTADVLRRFAAESTLGNFGIYFGNETAGRVHPLTMGA